MLAEKFILLLETVISRSYPDGSPRIVSTSRHVPIKLPSESGKLSTRSKILSADCMAMTAM
jgi:hypothetical protein